MATLIETFKQFDRGTGQWVTRSIERNMTPKKADVHKKVKMRQIKKVEPFAKSIFDA